MTSQRIHLQSTVRSIPSGRVGPWRWGSLPLYLDNVHLVRAVVDILAFVPQRTPARALVSAGWGAVDVNGAVLFLALFFAWMFVVMSSSSVGVLASGSAFFVWHFGGGGSSANGLLSSPLRRRCAVVLGSRSTQLLQVRGIDNWAVFPASSFVVVRIALAFGLSAAMMSAVELVVVARRMRVILSAKEGAHTKQARGSTTVMGHGCVVLASWRTQAVRGR